MTSGDPEPPYRGVEYPSLEDSAVPPPPHTAGHPPPAPGYGQWGGMPYPGGAPKPPGTNTNAIIAVVASALGVVLCGTTAIVGVILGVIAMRDTRRTGQDGHGIALAAVIIGGLVMSFWAIYFVVIAGLVFATPQWAP